MSCQIGFLAIVLLVSTSTVSAGVDCGRQSSGNDPYLPSKSRIIGGSYAKRFSWPWMVSNQLNNNHFCGGALIRVRDNKEESDIVLTAAHCVDYGKGNNPNYKGWTVVANLYWRSYVSDVTTRNVVKAVNHEQYVPVKNDIALLKLDKPIKFDENIRPVCLPKQGDSLPVGRVCVTAGWGRNHSTDMYMAPDILQQAVQPAQTAQTCTNSWGSGYDEKSMICAGPMDGSSSSCNGDSGGPFVCQGSDGRWVQYGAVSWGVGGKCNTEGYPPVYARVSSYIDWIRSKVNEMTSL